MTEARLALFDRLVAFAEQSRRQHLVVGDCWYSCPMSGDCCNEEAGDKCNCGAERYNAALDAMLRECRGVA